MVDVARARRLSEAIAQIVAEMLERRVKDPRLGFVTVTEARVTGDLREATVFYTVYGSDEERAASAVALASAAGLIGPDTVCVTTVHELQLREAGTIPVTGHDVLVDLIVTPERVIDCRPGRGSRPTPAIDWADLTDEKIAAIPLLSALRGAG